MQKNPKEGIEKQFKSLWNSPEEKGKGIRWHDARETPLTLFFPLVFLSSSTEKLHLSSTPSHPDYLLRDMLFCSSKSSRLFALQGRPVFLPALWPHISMMSTTHTGSSLLRKGEAQGKLWLFMHQYFLLSPTLSYPYFLKFFNEGVYLCNQKKRPCFLFSVKHRSVFKMEYPKTMPRF